MYLSQNLFYHPLVRYLMLFWFYLYIFLFSLEKEIIVVLVGRKASGNLLAPFKGNLIYTHTHTHTLFCMVLFIGFNYMALLFVEYILRFFKQYCTFFKNIVGKLHGVF